MTTPTHQNTRAVSPRCGARAVLQQSSPTSPAVNQRAAGVLSLQQRIDAAQEKADALRGKRGYSVALERLRNAKLAALAGGGE